MVKKSVYKQIVAMIEKNPGLPYTFQDVLNAGKRDVYFGLWGDTLSFNQKVKYSMELIDILHECMDEQIIFDELEDTLVQKPIALYLNILNSRLHILLSEGHLNGEALYSLGMELVTQSESLEEVKLGILILGHFENDLVRQIIKTFGLHSEFTLYAVEAAKYFGRYNSFLYDLIRGTGGFGKLAALTSFVPLSWEQKDWIFNYGIRNEAAPNISAAICLGKADMADFYLNCEITEESFSNLSYLLAYAGEKDDMIKFIPSLNLINRYLQAADIYANAFIDLAAIIVIKSSAALGMSNFDDYHTIGDWTLDERKRVGKTCAKILNKAKWEHIIQAELDTPKETTGLILMVVSESAITPWFGKLVPLLNRDSFDINVMDFTLMEYPDIYLDFIYEYLKLILPKEVFGCELLVLDGNVITSQYKPDIWVLYLLKAMVEQERNEKEFFLKCLTCRHPDVRLEAIGALQSVRGYWDEKVYKALEIALEREPMEKVRRKLDQTIKWSIQDQEKEQSYLNVQDVEIKPTPMDSCLKNTTIAGTFYRNMQIIEGKLGKGDILYLIREPNNEYDKNAILVVMEDGYVLGYVPKIDNPALAAMMDVGARLYAILDSQYISKGKPQINIMFNRPFDKDENIIPFPNE